jgi:hypothetical protein
MPFVGIGVGIGRQRFAQGGGIFAAYAARVAADGGVTEAGACVNAVSGISLNSSLLLVPSGYKSGVVYSEIPTDGDGDLTFTRASSATRVNSDGLIESPRTNLLLRSEDLTNGWSTEGLTVTANQTTAPDGNTTADTIQETAVTDVHRVYRSGITTVASTNYAFSFYVKKDTRRYVRLVLNQTTNAEIWAAAQFDLDNQTYTSGVGSGGGTFVSASILPDANGFYRITLVATATTTTTFAFLTLSDGTAISSSDSRGCNVYLGNTSNRIYAWGAQFETGSTATEYIPTTNSVRTTFAGITQDGTSASNVPRLDYSQGSCPALLLEPQRTNLVTYSEQFDNGAWSKTDITVTQNDAISPDGYQNADLITTGVSNSDQISRTITLAATNTITQSVFIKRVGGADWVDFITVRNGFANAVKVWFNISTLTVGGNYAAGTTSLNSASIENYGNGWLRLIVTTTDSTNNTNFDTRLRTASANLSDTRVNNSSYYLWGIQLEAGSYATSYIPTTSATVTRLADSCSKTGISSLIGQT